MFCHSCSRKALSLFIQPIPTPELTHVARSSPFRNVQASRFSSFPRPSQEPPRARPAFQRNSETHRDVNRDERSTEYPARPQGTYNKIYTPKEKEQGTETKPYTPKEKEPWQIQKAALQAKLKGKAWSPRKKISPDSMEGIRHLHQTYPEKFTTAVLSQHFKVSPDAIRRILKSKWRPNDEEEEERLRRWDKRGERIWTNLVEMGVKPPKRWRDMGVGRASPGEKPKWKSMSRNTVPVNESAREEDFSEDLIPIVDGRTGEPVGSRKDKTPFSDRL